MKKIYLPVVLLLSLAFQKAAAQPAASDVKAIILHQDSLFWQAYNQCDVAAMQGMFTEDMEFYHDMGGATKGLNSFLESVRKNLCNNPGFRLRREAVEGTVQVFPMMNKGAVYGAIISGSHYFYINEKGKAEYLDGLARFEQLWLLQDGNWKMSRVLSYDHKPATSHK